mmetsp:Transcript_24170/g.66691  ORF Transcript_24170/g.66691 Transcript_24170/m.66691 type:complete len:204 (-) Transcript_24170:809-1420(-)
MEAPRIMFHSWVYIRSVPWRRHPRAGVYSLDHYRQLGVGGRLLPQVRTRLCRQIRSEDAAHTTPFVLLVLGHHPFSNGHLAAEGGCMDNRDRGRCQQLDSRRLPRRRARSGLAGACPYPRRHIGPARQPDRLALQRVENPCRFRGGAPGVDAAGSVNGLLQGDRHRPCRRHDGDYGCAFQQLGPFHGRARVSHGAFRDATGLL